MRQNCCIVIESAEPSLGQPLVAQQFEFPNHKLRPEAAKRARFAKGGSTVRLHFDLEAGLKMGVVGWILIVVGIASLILGLVNGAKDVLKKSVGTEAIPAGFLAFLKDLLAAPPAKFFSVLGFLLVVVGLALNGKAVF